MNYGDLDALYWEIIGGCRRIQDGFDDSKIRPGHYWTWNEIMDARSGAMPDDYFLRPPYTDNFIGYFLELGVSMGSRGIDSGLPSLSIKTVRRKSARIIRDFGDGDVIRVL